MMLKKAVLLKIGTSLTLSLMMILLNIRKVANKNAKGRLKLRRNKNKEQQVLRLQKRSKKIKKSMKELTTQSSLENTLKEF